MPWMYRMTSVIVSEGNDEQKRGSLEDGGI